MRDPTLLPSREKANELLRAFGAACFDRTLDTVLFLTLFSALASGHGRTPSGLRRAALETQEILDACNGETVRTWWKRLRAKGWIGRDLQITREGQRRLGGLMPTIGWHDRWDHHWHLVSFDIPETHRGMRHQLRSVLHRLNFGKLHASLWISPRNRLGDVQAALSLPRTSRTIIFGTTERLGATESKDLAASIWPIQELNERYRSLLTVTRETNPKSHYITLASAFIAVLRDDPQLPRDLLPTPWHGFAALRACQREFGIPASRTAWFK